MQRRIGQFAGGNDSICVRNAGAIGMTIVLPVFLVTNLTSPRSKSMLFHEARRGR